MTPDATAVVALAAPRGPDLFARAPVALMTLDRQGRVRRINAAALAILEETEPGMKGQPFERWVAREDIQAWRDHLRRAKTLFGSSIEVGVLVRDRTATVRASSSHLGDEGESSMTALVDVTERVDKSKLFELLDASKIFVASDVTPKRVMEELGSIAVSLIGDLCVAQLRGTLGEVLHTSTAHALPELLPDVRLVASRIADPSGLRGIVDEALDSASPVFVDDQADELARLGLGSAVVLPLLARGVPAGILVIGTAAHRRPVGRREKQLAVELSRKGSLALDNALAFAGLRAPRAANDSTASSHVRILLVEDNADLREVTAMLLRRLQYEVEAVSTLQAARESLRKKRCDILVSDIRLPDGNGIDLMRELSSCDSGLKGIALSGLASPEEVDEALRAGFAAHLQKPVSFRDLGAAILKLV